jgi:peptide/nickel transport system ATP-binding protein
MENERRIMNMDNAGAAAVNDTPVLSVSEMGISFSMYAGKLEKSDLTVMQSISMDIAKGEIHGVVGSSGSGKSLFAHAILGILPANASMTGSIRFCGEELTQQRKEACRGRSIMLIPQSVDYLDPLMRVGEQAKGIFGTEQKRRAAFERYDLDESVSGRWPFQLSGGMARRVMISTALMGEAPALVIADEPTPGLGEELAAETMRQFRELADAGTSVLLITHELELAIDYADRVTVFYAGTAVETAPARDFAGDGSALRHPYSKALARALPQNGFEPLPGRQPYAGNLPPGCPFADRCNLRTDECATGAPMRALRGGTVRCLHAK